MRIRPTSSAAPPLAVRRRWSRVRATATATAGVTGRNGRLLARRLKRQLACLYASVELCAAASLPPAPCKSSSSSASDYCVACSAPTTSSRVGGDVRGWWLEASCPQQEAPIIVQHFGFLVATCRANQSPRPACCTPLQQLPTAQLLRHACTLDDDRDESTLRQATLALVEVAAAALVGPANATLCPVLLRDGHSAVLLVVADIAEVDALQDYGRHALGPAQCLPAVGDQMHCLRRRHRRWRRRGHGRNQRETPRQRRWRQLPDAADSWELTSPIDTASFDWPAGERQSELPAVSGSTLSGGCSWSPASSSRDSAFFTCSEVRPSVVRTDTAAADMTPLTMTTSREAESSGEEISDLNRRHRLRRLRCRCLSLLGRIRSSLLPPPGEESPTRQMEETPLNAAEPAAVEQACRLLGQAESALCRHSLTDSGQATAQTIACAASVDTLTCVDLSALGANPTGDDSLQLSEAEPLDALSQPQCQTVVERLRRGSRGRRSSKPRLDALKQPRHRRRLREANN